MVFPKSSEQVILCKDFEWLVFLLVLVFLELLVFLPVSPSLPRGKRLCKKIEHLFFSISLFFFPLFGSVQREVLLILCNIWGYNFGLNWESICKWKLEINKAVKFFCRTHFCIQSTQPSYTTSSSLMILFEPAMQGKSHCMPSHCWLLKASEDNNVMDLVSITCAADFYSSFDLSSTWI